MYTYDVSPGSKFICMCVLRAIMSALQSPSAAMLVPQSCLVTYAIIVTPVHQTDRCFVSNNDIIMQTWLFLQPTVTEQVRHMLPSPQPDQTINGFVFVCLSACHGQGLEVSPAKPYVPHPRWPLVLLH